MTVNEAHASVVSEVEKRKWQSFAAFVAMDIIQILFVAILYLDPDSLFVIGIDLSRSSPLVSASLVFSIGMMQVVMIYTFAYSVRHNREMVRLYPKTANMVDWPCKYSCSEIVQWTAEVARASGQTVNEIYLMKSPIPNAFTFSLPILGSMVVVNSNILDLLRPDEVKSIIAHEIGHIKNRDSIMSILMRMPTAFVEVIYLYVYLRLMLAILDSLMVDFDLFSAAIRAVVLISVFALSRALILVVMLFIQRASRQAELLADYHAATILGPDATINALLVLGQRVETVTALIQEIQRLEALDPTRRGRTDTKELMTMIRSYPLDGIDENMARERAPGLFLRAKLTALRDIYGVQLDDEQIEQAIAPAVERLVQKRQEQSLKQEAAEKRQTIDWRDMDHNLDSRLTDAELSELIRRLRANPDKLLFSNELGRNELLLEHPNFRRRVLFLADAFGF